MSTGLFSIARTAMTTHQIVLETISQNIANAETPGYSRKEAMLSATPPVSMPYGSVGTGVNVDTIRRKRDVLLDDGFRSANALAGQSEMRSTLMGQVEEIFGEPTDQGMANALDQFWNAWSDLSATPDSLAARSVVQQRGRQLAQRFNDFDTQLTQQRTSNLGRLTSSVDQINAIASQVAELNVRIVTSESNGNTNNDLRDLRDVKLDELAKLAGTRVLKNLNGSVSVLIGNSTLVDGETATPVRAEAVMPVPPPTTPLTDIPVRLRIGDSPDPLYPLGGQIAAIRDVLNTDIPQLRGRLDAMASQLVATVNATHAAGFTFTGPAIPGTAAGNFFAPGTLLVPVNAANISLDAAITANAARIAASGNANGPTDNAVAQAMAALRIQGNTVTWTDPKGTTESGSFVSFFRSSMTRLGIEVSTASDNAGVMASLVEQADVRRQSVSGVNTDEELVQMMRVQQAYVAASKMIKVADEMLQTLLGII